MADGKKIILVALSHSNFTGGIQKYNGDVIDAIRSSCPTADVEMVDLFGFESKTSSVKSFSGNKYFFFSALVKSFFNADIVIWGHSVFLSLIPILSVFKRVTGGGKTTQILQIHGTDITGRRMNFLSRQGLRMCDSIISCSKRTANSLMEKYSFVSSDNITVINPAIPSVLDSVNTKLTGSCSRQLKVLTVGRIEPYKLESIRRLIRAVSLMTGQGVSVEFNIVGAGSCIDELRKLVADINIPHLTVHVHGYVDDPKVHYRDADLFFLVNKYEGFGIVYLEAMAHGVPCMAAKNSGACEVVVHGETGFLIDDESDLEIKRNLELFLANDDLREKMKFNASRHAAGFNMEAFRKSVQRVLQL